MRRRKVTIAVSENFYNLLENHRKKTSEQINSREIFGYNSIPFVAYTDMLSKNVKLGNIRLNNGKQKRRRY